MNGNKNIVRERTFTWPDPNFDPAKVAPMSGLEIMTAIKDGDLPGPPIMHLLAYDLLEVSQGRVVFGLNPAEFHYNMLGTVHGGIHSTLLDSAMGCAVHTQLGAGIGYTTTQLNVNFVRPLTDAIGYVRCEGNTIHVGRSLATADGRIVDEAGKLYAHGTTTCMVFPLK